MIKEKYAIEHKTKKRKSLRTREKNLNPRVIVLKELWQLTESCCRCPEFSVCIPWVFQGAPADFQHQDPLLCNLELSFSRTLKACSDCTWHTRILSPPSSALVTLRQMSSQIWFISRPVPSALRVGILHNFTVSHFTHPRGLWLKHIHSACLLHFPFLLSPNLSEVLCTHNSLYNALQSLFQDLLLRNQC